MSFQTRKTFVYLWNTKYYIFDEIRELSDTAETATQLQCSQSQKCSMDIGKTVHVTLVAQLQFYESTQIRFVCKGNQNNNLFNNSSPWVTIFRHFGEHHDACARFAQNVINVIISVVYIQHARFLLNVNNADWSHVVMMYFIYCLRLHFYFWGLYLGLNSWKFFYFYEYKLHNM